MPTIEQLERLLAVDPDDAFVLFGLAMEHAKAGGHETALDYFDRAIGADPANAYHHFHKARSLEALERTDEAATTLRAGLAAARSHGDQKAWGEIAGYLDMLGEDP